MTTENSQTVIDQVVGKGVPIDAGRLALKELGLNREEAAGIAEAF